MKLYGGATLMKILSENITIELTEVTCRPGHQMMYCQYNDPDTKIEMSFASADLSITKNTAIGIFQSILSARRAK